MRGALLVMLAACGAQTSGSDVDARVIANTDASSDDSPVTIVDAPPDAPPPCVEGEMRMLTASGCFAAVTSTKVVRSEAQTACAGYGMHLAYVRSAADEATIAMLANGNDVAIGLSDVATENTFIWDDGSPLTYTDWRTGEPNNGNGQYQEDCAVFAGTKVPPGWDDKPCAPPPVGTGAYGYVCQR